MQTVLFVLRNQRFHVKRSLLAKVKVAGHKGEGCIKEKVA